MTRARTAILSVALAYVASVAIGLVLAHTGNGFALRSFDLHKPSLHDVFLHLVGGPLTGDKP